MTRQEMFDKAVKGLAGQGFQRSMTDIFGIGDATCAYRGDDGLKCAIGHLILDEVYRKSIESFGVFTDQIHKALEDSGVLPPQGPMRGFESCQETFMNLRFLNALQTCHDKSSTPEDMKSKLIDCAKTFDLAIPKELE